ncbi:hypothetical protein HIV01_007060 [Lysobacter arenosi]|jgi:hypothetical protein|uniref:Secreted protein n=1 Tax=Lysobacter arenosi TaxID=2795387 RepID=A0ABX7RHA4_9GAMM|nr:hypothetical protein [Lysobacter arenosi]QSX76241.1 hypothetical protein HIV01_007060 [Lysobacter arenosi]
MRKSRLIAATLAAFAFLSCLHAVAENTDGTSAKVILDQQQQIRTEAGARQGRYRDMAQANLEALFVEQDNVTRLLRGIDDTRQLPERDQIALFNSLEAIEGILNDTQDERLVCERFKPIGSNRTEVSCRTAEQRRLERANAEKDMTRDQRCNDVWSSGHCTN